MEIILSQQFMLLMSLKILSVLAQEIILNQFKSQISSLSERTIKTLIKPKNQNQIEDVSLFGWILINSQSSSGDIFDFCYGTCPNDDPEENNGVFLFSLQFISWADPALMISFSKKGEEPKVTTLLLSPFELNTWMFVHLGHSFVHSKQTYFKQSLKNQQRMVLDEVPLKPEQNSQPEYILIVGNNQLSQRNLFSGEINRLTVQFGEKAYNEVDFEQLQALHPDSVARFTCSVFFSDCAYIGKAINNCQTTSSQPIKNIKSILFRNPSEDYICFGEKKILIKKNVECITDEKLFDLEQSDSIIVGSSYDNTCRE